MEDESLFTLSISEARLCDSLLSEARLRSDETIQLDRVSAEYLLHKKSTD